MRKSSLSKPREKLMFTIGHDGKKLYIEIGASASLVCKLTLGFHSNRAGECSITPT